MREATKVSQFLEESDEEAWRIRRQGRGSRRKEPPDQGRAESVTRGGGSESGEISTGQAGLKNTYPRMLLYNAYVEVYISMLYLSYYDHVLNKLVEFEIFSNPMR